MSICRYDWGTYNPSYGCTYQQCNECGWNIDEREATVCEITTVIGGSHITNVMFYHDMCYEDCRK